MYSHVQQAVQNVSMEIQHINHQKMERTGRGVLKIPAHILCKERAKKTQFSGKENPSKFDA